MSLGRVSVPVWGINLSVPLPIVALVSRYLTNKLMGRMPILYRISFLTTWCQVVSIRSISPSFDGLSSCIGQVAYALRTRAPVATQIASYLVLPLDLHVLSLSLAFILSQDQTLHCYILICLFLCLAYLGCLSFRYLSEFLLPSFQLTVRFL